MSMKSQPQFLSIRWEDTPTAGRQSRWRRWRASGTAGKSRSPTPAPEALAGGGKNAISARAAIPEVLDRSPPNSPRSQLGSPDGKPGTSGRSRRPAPSNKSGIGALLQGARGDCGAAATIRCEPD